MKININGTLQEGYIVSPMNYVTTIQFYKDENYIEVTKDEYVMKMKHHLIDGEYDITVKYPIDLDTFKTAVSLKINLPQRKFISLKGCVLEMEKATDVSECIVRIPFTYKKIESLL